MKKTFVAIILVSFVLNLVWENLEAPLYQSYQGFWSHFPLCLLGTFGDVAAIVIGYIVVGLVRKRANWLSNLKFGSLAVFFLFELVLAYLVEWYALSQKFWIYTSSMPDLFSTRIGLLPLLQLGVIGITSVFIVKIGFKRILDYL